MPQKSRIELLRLVELYLNGTATAQERQILEEYYELFDEAWEVTEDLDNTQLHALGLEMKDEINRKLKPKQKETLRLHRYFRVAAMIIMLMGVIWLVRLYTLKENTQQAVETAAPAAREQVNRFFTLSDGTKVVLRGNSQLKISDDFNQAKRIVTLIGEAYFDVAHNPDSPFIIYTGRVKTTVLGTAFNIKAWPGQKDIIVSVSRGKVRVEDQNKLIAVLTPEKQVIYNTETLVGGEQQVATTAATAWLQQEVTFDEMTFKDLAALLSKRHGTQIHFLNPELENCRFTGIFSGTETLEESMHTLSLTSNTRYKILADKVLIDGEKCI